MRGGWFAAGGGPLLQDGGHTRVEDPSRLGGGISFLFCGSHYTGTVAAFVPSLILCLTCPIYLRDSHGENLHNYKINLGQGRPGYEVLE